MDIFVFMSFIGKQNGSKNGSPIVPKALIPQAFIRNRISTPFTTRFTRWQRTRRATAKPSRACLTDISANNSGNIRTLGRRAISKSPFFFRIFPMTMECLWKFCLLRFPFVRENGTRESGSFGWDNYTVDFVVCEYIQRVICKKVANISSQTRVQIIQSTITRFDVSVNDVSK